MKIIIAGTRWLTDVAKVEAAIEQILEATGWNLTEVVSGLADGPDIIGANWAKRQGIPVKPFEPNWKRHPGVAGFMRNAQMGQYADGLIAIWNGKSSGTKDMIDIMRRAGKPYRVSVNFNPIMM